MGRVIVRAVGALLSLFLFLSALISVATAQVVPEPLSVRPQVDERGVNVIDNTVLLGGVAALSIGPSTGGLSFEMVYSGTGWRSSALGTIYNSGTTWFVSFGRSADTFAGPASFSPQCGGRTLNLGSSTLGSGATLVLNYFYDCEVSAFEYQTWTYTGRDGAVYTFDATFPEGAGVPTGTGNVTIDRIVLTSASFPGGERIVYNYEPIHLTGGAVTGRLLSMTSNLGYAILFEYALNTATQFSQFSQWRTLRKATAFDATADVCSGSPCTFANSWPSLSFTGTEAQVDSVTDAAGRVTAFSYNSGRLSSVRFPGSSAAVNNLAYGYDASFNVNSVTVNGSAWSYSKTDSGANRTIVVRNALNQTVRTVVSSIATRLVASDTDGLGNSTSYTYYPSGLPQTVTAPEGNAVTYVYDARGNPTQTTAIAKPGSGLANIVTSAVYPATCVNLTTCNKPTSITGPLGEVTDYTYDPAHGGVTSVVLPPPAAGGVRQQVTTAYTAFPLGLSVVYRPTTITTCVNAQACANTANESRTSVTYTGPHLLPTAVTGGGGDGALAATTALSYTTAGDVATVDGPLPGPADTAYFFYDVSRAPIGGISPDPDNAGALLRRATRTTFIPGTGLVDVVDQGTATGTSLAALNAMVSLVRTDTDYDNFGRPITARNIVGGLTQGVAQTSYDAVGRTNCTALRMNASIFSTPPADACALGAAGSFGNDRITQNTYDVLDRIISVTRAKGVAASELVEAKSFTANGATQTVTDGNGARTTYEYDGFDRLTKTRFPHPTSIGTSSATDFEQLTYDIASRITQRRLRDGQLIGYSYDNRQRLTFVDMPGTADDVTNRYDVAGRITASELLTGVPSALSTTFAWDILGRLTTESTKGKPMSYQYDLAGNRTRVTWPDTAFFVDYAYNNVGEMTQVREKGATTGVGVLATYAYNDLGQRTSITRGNGVTSTYQYNDPAKRLSQIVHNLDGATTTNDLTVDLTYTPASQIASRASSNDLYSWTQYVSQNVVDVVDGLNRIVSSGGTTISHDARGNLTSDGVKTFVYDAQNRLVSGNGATLKYDALGRLYETSKTGFTTTRLFYDGAEVAIEYSASGAILRRYVRGANPDEVLVWYEGSGTTSRRFLIADERGSIIAGTSATGATLFKNLYDEYGRPGSANQGRFQYTGQMWLAEAGLYHYKARLYDPGLGRFLQTDPIGYADGLNLYAYVGGDPVNATDPSGLEIDEVVVVGIRRDYNTFLEQSLRDIAFGGGFGGRGELGGGAGRVAQDTKAAVDQALCGSGGSSVDIADSTFAEADGIFAQVGAAGLGIGDAFTFGLYSRAFSSLPGGLGSYYSSEKSLSGYDAGLNGATIVSGLRLVYATTAKAGSLLSSSGRAASEFRNNLKGALSGLGRSHPRIYSYEQLLAKYGTDDAVRAAAGRTDPILNALAASGAAGGTLLSQCSN